MLAHSWFCLWADFPFVIKCKTLFFFSLLKALKCVNTAAAALVSWEEPSGKQVGYVSPLLPTCIFQCQISQKWHFFVSVLALKIFNFIYCLALRFHPLHLLVGNLNLLETVNQASNLACLVPGFGIGPEWKTGNTGRYYKKKLFSFLSTSHPTTNTC